MKRISKRKIHFQQLGHHLAFWENNLNFLNFISKSDQRSCVSQVSLEGVCVQERGQRDKRHRQFKELAYKIMNVGESEIHGTSCQGGSSCKQ